MDKNISMLSLKRLKKKTRAERAILITFFIAGAVSLILFIIALASSGYVNYEDATMIRQVLSSSLFTTLALWIFLLALVLLVAFIVLRFIRPRAKGLPRVLVALAALYLPALCALAFIAHVVIYLAT